MSDLPEFGFMHRLDYANGRKIPSEQKQVL